MKTLKLGSSGAEVKYLQELLLSHQIKVTVDGSFGPKTKEAVKVFQLSRKLTDDGIVGPMTWEMLEKSHNIEVDHGDYIFKFNKPYSVDEFEKLVDTVQWGTWKPSVIVIHHTAAPSLETRPNGLTSQHIINIKDYYESMGWIAGPHLFIDDHQIWSFSDLTKRGVHARGFNNTGIGIEMLGNFDSESPWTGRGLVVLTKTAKAVKALMKKLGLTKKDIRFHRDDPLTSKSCPGTKIDKQKFLDFLDIV